MSEKTKKEPITYSRYGDYLIPNLILDNGKVRPKNWKIWKAKIKIFKRRNETSLYKNVNGRYANRLFIRSRC